MTHAPALAVVSLFGVTMLWCLLPFVPAFVELYRRSDTTPLPIIRDHDGNIRRFAGGLRAYLEAQLAPLSISASGTEPLEGRFPDGTPFLIIPTAPPLGVEPFLLSGASEGHLIVSYRPLAIPAGAVCSLDLYAAGAVDGGEGAVYRAVLSDGPIHLGYGSTVLRWIHSEVSLRTEPECALFGRASAEQTMILGAGCRFQRLHGRRIQFGAGPEPRAADLPPLASDAGPRRRPFRPDQSVEVTERRHLVRGDLTIPAGGSFHGDLIVTGCLRIEEGVHVEGSIKCHDDIHLGADVRVDGSLVGCRAIYLGPGCRAAGPVIAEQRLTLEAGCELGKEGRPTTVSAPWIHVGLGVLAFGTVWARTEGSVAIE